jgi:hypothetical protein
MTFAWEARNMIGRVRDFLLILISLAVIEPANAQTDQLCGREQNTDDFVGAYTVEIGSALLKGGGKSIALKATETFPAIMSEIDGQLELQAGPHSIAFRIADENEADWKFDPVADLQIDSADFEILMGCSIRDLPRLIGEGVSKSTVGVPIAFTYRLIAYTVDVDGVIDLVGSLSWSGGGVGMSRVVKMSRN